MSLPAGAEPLRAEKDAELKRHIEPRQMRAPVELRARDIVNAQPAFPDNANDLVDPDSAGVVRFERAARHVIALEHREDGRMQQRPVAHIEGAIDEDAAVVLRRDASRATARPSRRHALS